MSYLLFLYYFLLVTEIKHFCGFRVIGKLGELSFSCHSADIVPETVSIKMSRWLDENWVRGRQRSARGHTRIDGGKRNHTTVSRRWDLVSRFRTRYRERMRHASHTLRQFGRSHAWRQQRTTAYRKGLTRGGPRAQSGRSLAATLESLPTGHPQSGWASDSRVRFQQATMRVE